VKISDKSIEEINDIIAKFFVDEYFREERAGHSMLIYEIIDMVFKGIDSKASTLLEEKREIIDKYYQEEYIRTVIYATLVQIGKETYRHYIKNISNEKN